MDPERDPMRHPHLGDGLLGQRFRIPDAELAEADAVLGAVAAVEDDVDQVSRVLFAGISGAFRDEEALAALSMWPEVDHGVDLG